MPVFGEKFPVVYGSTYKRNKAGQIVVDANGLPQVGEDDVIGRVSPDFRLGFNTNIELYKFRIAPCSTGNKADKCTAVLPVK